MPPETVYVRVSQTRSRWGRTPKQLIEEFLSKLSYSGDADIDAVLHKAGMVALGHIKKAFIAKSRGGSDEVGDRWQPLSPRTIVYSRKAGRTKTERGRASHPSQALTKKQQQRWWDLYRRGLAIYNGDKEHAARRAWFILKSEGVTTLFDKYRSAKVDILRVTDSLLNGMLVRVEGGEILIEATAKHSAAHHYGTSHIPQRRLWPEPSRWPQSWWDDITGAIQDGLNEIVSGGS